MDTIVDAKLLIFETKKRSFQEKRVMHEMSFCFNNAQTFALNWP